MSVTGSTSEKARQERRGRFFLGCFFSVFLIIGLAVTTFMFVVPLVRILSARSWRATPCTILKSDVATHRGSKGSLTYSIEVTYEYSVDDQTYSSSQYWFAEGSSSGYDGKKEVVDRIPPGTRSTCYVNRRNPREAVLERGVTGELFLGLIPMVFALVGGGGLFAVFIYKKKPRAPVAATSHHPPAPGSKPGAARLKASASPVGRLGCTFFLAVFWNGIVSVFFLETVSGWVQGNPDGCLTLFIIPFLLVGLGLIGLVGYYFLALFNPRPVLQVSSASAALGDTVEIEWETPGNVDRVKGFTITLEGREEATYRRGTSTATDKSTFATIEIVKSTKGRDMRRGKAKVAIPADSMHSFKSSNNKFVWSFQLKGDIPKWPDVSEEFPFEVLPQRPPPGGAA
jgi:hypothetical protein